MNEPKEIPAAILEAAAEAVLFHPHDGNYTRLAKAALEAAGVPDLIAERDRLAKANAGSWSLYQECVTANEGLAAENRQLLARIAKLEAALHKVVHSQDVAMPIELDEEVTKLLSAESVEVSE